MAEDRTMVIRYFEYPWGFVNSLIVAVLCGLGSLALSEDGNWYARPLLIIAAIAAVAGVRFFLSRKVATFDSVTRVIRIERWWPRKTLFETFWIEGTEILQAGSKLLFVEGGPEPVLLFDLPWWGEKRALNLRLRILSLMAPGFDGANPAFYGYLKKLSEFKPVTSGLVAMNVVIFIAALLIPGLEDRGVLLKSAFEEGEYWRVLTSMFLHAGLVHLVMNMLALSALGSLVETLLERTRTVIVYFASGLAGGLWALVWLKTDLPLVGASGAIFGLFGSLCYLKLNAERLKLVPESVPTQKALVTNLFLNFAISLLPFVSLAAHFGGFVAGFIVTHLVVRRPS